MSEPCDQHLYERAGYLFGMVRMYVSGVTLFRGHDYFCFSNGGKRALVALHVLEDAGELDSLAQEVVSAIASKEASRHADGVIPDHNPDEWDV